MGNIVELYPEIKEIDITTTKQPPKVPQKRSFAKRLIARFPRYVVFFLVGYIAFGFGNQLLKINAMNREVEKVNQQIAALEDKNQALKVEIKKLKTNSYVERIAREKLGLVKPGEVVILPAQTNMATDKAPKKLNVKDIH